MVDRMSPVVVAKPGRQLDIEQVERANGPKQSRFRKESTYKWPLLIMSHLS